MPQKFSEKTEKARLHATLLLRADEVSAVQDSHYVGAASQWESTRLTVPAAKAKASPLQPSVLFLLRKLALNSFHSFCDIGMRQQTCTKATLVTITARDG